MLIDQVKYERRTERAVLELEQMLNKLVACKKCSGRFLPNPVNRSICDECKYVDNDYRLLE